jgi:hypothetical protein
MMNTTTNTQLMNNLIDTQPAHAAVTNEIARARTALRRLAAMIDDYGADRPWSGSDRTKVDDVTEIVRRLEATVRFAMGEDEAGDVEPR